MLVRAGPMTASELNGSPTADERRLYDIRQLNPTSQTTAVQYLGEYHDPERVLRRWFNANTDTLKQTGVSGKALTYSLSEPFDAVWEAVRDEPQYGFLKDTSDHSGEQGEQETQPCPRCEREDIGNLPRHLRSCDGGSE